MNDLLIIAVFAISGSFLLYWFWPGSALCAECDSELDTRNFCFCTNEHCFYNENQQEVRSY